MANSHLCSEIISGFESNKDCTKLKKSLSDKAPTLCPNLKKNESAIKNSLYHDLSCSQNQAETIFNNLEKCIGCVEPKTSLSGGAIAGIVIGSLAFIVIVVFIILRMRKKKGKRRKK